MGKIIEAEWGAMGDGKTAVIEMARSSGLALIAGPTAAIAVPPQIAVPEPSKYVSFLDTPNIFPAISTSMNAPITYKEIKRK